MRNVSPRLPASPHLSPPLPTSPHLSPSPLPITSPHLSPSLPISPRLSPSLPLSPHLSPSLPISPPLVGASPSTRLSPRCTPSLRTSARDSTSRRGLPSLRTSSDPPRTFSSDPSPRTLLGPSRTPPRTLLLGLFSSEPVRPQVVLSKAPRWSRSFLRAIAPCAASARRAACCEQRLFTPLEPCGSRCAVWLAAWLVVALAFRPPSAAERHAPHCAVLDRLDNVGKAVSFFLFEPRFSFFYRLDNVGKAGRMRGAAAGVCRRAPSQFRFDSSAAALCQATSSSSLPSSRRHDAAPSRRAHPELTRDRPRLGTTR